MANITKSTSYKRYKESFTSSLHLGTIHIETEYLDRTRKTTVESIQGMTWHNKIVDSNKEVELLSANRIELTETSKEYFDTGYKRVAIDKIHGLQDVTPNEDKTYTYSVSTLEGEIAQILDNANHITSQSDGLVGEMELEYNTGEEDVEGKTVLNADVPATSINFSERGSGSIEKVTIKGKTEGSQSVKAPQLVFGEGETSSIPFSFFEGNGADRWGWYGYAFKTPFSGKIKAKLKNSAPNDFRLNLWIPNEKTFSNADLRKGVEVEVSNATHIGFHAPSYQIASSKKGRLLELIKKNEVIISLQEKGKPNIYSYGGMIVGTPSDLIMRSNGEVYDELDLLSGRLIQRIDGGGRVMANPINRTIAITLTNDVKSLTYLKGSQTLRTQSETIIPTTEIDYKISNSVVRHQGADIEVENGKAGKMLKGVMYGNTEVRDTWTLRDKWTTKKTVGTNDGNVGNGNDAITLDLLPMPSLSPFKVCGNVAYKKIVFYGKFGNFLKGKEISTTADLIFNEADIPKNAMYIRLSQNTSNPIDLVIKDLNDNVIPYPQPRLMGVENPVVSVINGNMWSSSARLSENLEDWGKSAYSSWNRVMKLKPNTRYRFNATFRIKNGQLVFQLGEQKSDGTRVGLVYFNKSNNTPNLEETNHSQTFITNDTGDVFVNFYPCGNETALKWAMETIKQSSISIFEETKYPNDTKLDIESNHISTTPKITLHGLKDVKDEWDMVNETVTRRVGRVVIDGSDDEKLGLSLYNGVKIFKIPVVGVQDGADSSVCNRLTRDNNINNNFLHYKQTNNGFEVFFTDTNMTLEQFKAWLSKNPLEFVYKLPTPIIEPIKITPPSPKTSTASITLPSKLNHVGDVSDFVAWNPYKEHYVRYNHTQNGEVLSQHTYENLTELNKRQFVGLYGKRTYVEQQYANKVSTQGDKGLSKYVLIEPNKDYTVTLLFTETPDCETIKVNLGGAETEMRVDNPQVHITTPQVLLNNMCSISGYGLKGKMTNIMVLPSVGDNKFVDIDYFDGLNNIGEIKLVDDVAKASIVLQQTNGNLFDQKLKTNGNNFELSTNNLLSLRPNKKYVLKARQYEEDYSYYLYMQKYNSNKVSSPSVPNIGGSKVDIKVLNFTTENHEVYGRVYSNNVRGDLSMHTQYPIELCYADMVKDGIRPCHHDEIEFLLPMQLCRVGSVYDNLFYDELKGYYRIQQSIGHKYFVGADNESWSLVTDRRFDSERLLRFRYNNMDIQIKALGEFMTNRFTKGAEYSPYESCAFIGNNFVVSIDKERLDSPTLDGFKRWLSNNNLHLYYQLSTPIMIELPQYAGRVGLNTYKDELYTFPKNCKPTIFTLDVPIDKTYRFYESKQGQGNAKRVELTDERLTDEDVTFIDKMHGSGISNLIENPNNVETMLKPNYEGKAVNHTLTNSRISTINIHGFEPNETTVGTYNNALKRYELVVQNVSGINSNSYTLGLPYKLEKYADGSHDTVSYNNTLKQWVFNGETKLGVTFSDDGVFTTPVEVFKGMSPRSGLIGELKVRFNSGVTSARLYYNLGTTTNYNTIRGMSNNVDFYIGFFNTGGTKIDYATKIGADSEYTNLAPLSSVVPECLILTQLQGIAECTYHLDKTYYYQDLTSPIELSLYNGTNTISTTTDSLVEIRNNGLNKKVLSYEDETYTLYWTYVGGEGDITVSLGGTTVSVSGQQGYVTFKTQSEAPQNALIVGGYNLSIKDLMLVKGDKIEGLSYFEGSRAVGTAFIDEDGTTKYKISLVSGKNLVDKKFEERITFEDDNKHNVVVTKLLGKIPKK